MAQPLSAPSRLSKANKEFSGNVSSKALFGWLQMRLKPVYATDQELVDSPLTDTSSQWAPKKGVHLYHFPLSLDSQKARVCLEELGIEWVSHVILLTAHEQYSPRYVRINSRCVVPTLVIDGKVTTDTANILSHLAQRFGAEKQCFQTLGHEKEGVDVWIDKAASLFIEALTYGHIEGTKKTFPWNRANNDGKSHLYKINLLSKLIEKHQDDETLKLAYEKKRAVTEATRGAIITPTQMSAIVDSTKAGIDALERQLESGSFSVGGWLASKALSLADVQWGVVLYRLEALGLQPLLWDRNSRINSYTEKLFTRDSFQRGVADWLRVFRRVALPMLRYKLLNVLGLNRNE